MRIQFQNKMRCSTAFALPMKPKSVFNLKVANCLVSVWPWREGLLVNDKEVQCREPQSPEHLKTHSFQPFACNHPISAPGRSKRLGEWHPLQRFGPIWRKQQRWWQLKFLLCGLHATCGNRFVYKSEDWVGSAGQNMKEIIPCGALKGEESWTWRPTTPEGVCVCPSSVSRAFSFLKALSKGALGTANAFRFSYWWRNLRDMNSYHQSWFCGRASDLFGYTSSRVFLCQFLVTANAVKVPLSCVWTNPRGCSSLRFS